MSRHRVVTSAGIYFITFCCHNWISLIERTKAYDSVYQFFNILNCKQSLLAFVVMPNHLHFLLHYKETGQSLNTIIGNGKRFMAYEIVKRLKCQQEFGVLQTLSAGVLYGEQKNKKIHAIWQQSFDVKECRSERRVAQKLGYIHHNPIRGKWRLSESLVDYEHSSANFYYSGKQHEHVKLTHFRDALHTQQFTVR
jgi:REP element-mobilizing transposase RayT